MMLIRNLSTRFGPLKVPLSLFFANKALLLAISLIVPLFLAPGAGYEPNTPNDVLNRWAQWDGKAYLTIADQGYVTLPDGRSLHNFLPFYPFLIRVLSFIGSALAGFLISNIASLIAIVFLYKLVQLDYPRAVSNRTAVFLLFFPTTFFLTAIYTESLFLMFVVLTFYFARKGQWLLAGAFSIALPLTRIIGFGFFIPLLVEYYHQRSFSLRRTDRRVAYALFPLIGVAIYLLISATFFGSPFAYGEQENLWSRSLQLPHMAFVKTISDFTNATSVVLLAYFMWSAAIALAAIALFVVQLRRIRWSYSAYTFIALVPPLLSGTLEAFSRFVLVIFPFFLTLALLAENKRWRWVLAGVYAAFVPLLIFLTARFVVGAVG